MRMTDLRGQQLSRSELLKLVPRAAMGAEVAVERVRPLVAAVAERGEAALRQQARDFDGVEGHALRVPVDAISGSLSDCPADVRAALEELIARLRLGSAAQVPAPQTTQIGDGAVIRQRWQPVSRVGLYAPGGKAAYPSSVIMNAVSAQTAGVPGLALASPAQSDNAGLPHQAVLWAAALCGIDEVYAIGGAGAIAAFAHGVPEIGLDPVDVVTGPGNVFVAAAKRVVSGLVGIDSEAGTTEILVIADDSADPRFVAADLISQAEHDEAAASVLVTDSADFAERVQREVQARAPLTRHAERVAVALAGPQSAVILVDDLGTAVRVSNAYGPEHLEIQTRDDEHVLSGITDAGAIFVGSYTPVSLGDYLAGSNHVLPTGGTARFAAGLGAHTFLRPQQIISYDRAALAATEGPLLALAGAEGLPAHGEAVSARFEEGK
ncbi:histidinol dehydrogenase [Leucobacter chromiireducens]|uniref:Histidinol dehydrogenase n=1 Tax=Leucobacter chromiireducens subsp. chromiireducens TaxID=660067 RepID=A0ABS1SR78_9MICO|nr:histidinol dehydrogenase [Leucobacter chromiireducens]MBL3690661.1 histidinol dehydrogenase [Leucobacter chromiireducens subsp. chromiireducens]